jgi:hypothetical protein
LASGDEFWSSQKSKFKSEPAHNWQGFAFMERSPHQRELRRLIARRVRAIVNARLWAYFQILKSEILARIRGLIDAPEADGGEGLRQLPPRL